MKKHLILSLFLSSATLMYSQSQRLIIKTDSTKSIRYWPLDGKQLPFYDLSNNATSKQENTISIHLESDKTIYNLLTDKKEIFQVYTSSNKTDTVTLCHDSLVFSGDNRQYNHYLKEINKADQYCRAFSTTRNHPLSKVNSLAAFKTFVSERKEEELHLLTDNAFTAEFIQQQNLLTDLRYKALFLKKIITLHNSPDLTEDWINEFKHTDFHFTEESARQSVWYHRMLKDYTCIKSFILEKNNPQEVANSINTFLFENYCNILTGKNLEYAIAYLLYDDIFQQEYSKDTPSLYQRFITLFPNSLYIDILSPGIKKTADFYNQQHTNTNIHILNYETDPQSFADLMQPFAGKVVYIDIWATTCSPCLKSFAEINKWKQQIAHSDEIVFCYISIDREQAHEKWMQAINYYKLEGYHYRVNERTAQIIYSTFGNSKGMLTIPHYAIVDKKGKITFMNAAPPADSQKVSEQLNSLFK